MPTGVSQVRYYFDMFKDRAHRCDLAYQILELAIIAKAAKVNIKGLCHPDNWIWVDDGTSGGRIIFNNALNNADSDDYDFKQQEEFCPIVYQADSNNEIYLPLDDNPSNLCDALAFAIMLVTGRYDSWMAVEGAYTGHSNPAVYKYNDRVTIRQSELGSDLIQRCHRGIKFMAHGHHSIDNVSKHLDEIMFEGDHLDLESRPACESEAVRLQRDYGYLGGARFWPRKALISATARRSRRMVFLERRHIMF